jgi:hypothetical protein
MTWMSLKQGVLAAIDSVGAASIGSFPIDLVQVLKKGIEFGPVTRKSLS